MAGHLAGFKRELALLANHPRVTVRVHVTKPSPALEPPCEKPTTQTLTTLEEKLSTRTSATTTELPTPPSTPPALEPKLPISTHTEALATPNTNLSIHTGRPNIPATLARAASECSASDRILVAVCGPAGLADGVREAVARSEGRGGPGFVLHAEAFGW